MRVFLWLAVDLTREQPIIACEASRQAAIDTAEEILPAGEEWDLQEWEVGFSRAGPTVEHRVVGVK